MKSLNPIGRTIRFMRKKKHVSQTELARAVGVTQPTVSCWENDRSRANILQEAEIFRYLGLREEEVLLLLREKIDDVLKQHNELEVRRGPSRTLDELENALETSELPDIKREGFKNLLAAIRADQLSVHRRTWDLKLFLHVIESAENKSSEDSEKTTRNPE